MTTRLGLTLVEGFRSWISQEDRFLVVLLADVPRLGLAIEHPKRDACIVDHLLKVAEEVLGSRLR